MTGAEGFAIIVFVDDASSSDGELCNGSTYDSDSYRLGSNPSSPAICLHGQAVKTLPSQGRIRGSIPLGGARTHAEMRGFFFFVFGEMRDTPSVMPAACHLPQEGGLETRRKKAPRKSGAYFPLEAPGPTKKMRGFFLLFPYASVIKRLGHPLDCRALVSWMHWRGGLRSGLPTSENAGIRIKAATGGKTNVCHRRAG